MIRIRLRVVVVGVPGVGKSTVVEAVASAWKGSRLVTFGTVMLEEGLRLKWIRHRDQLRKMRVEEQTKLQRIAARKISAMKESVLFVDTHLFIRTPEGFWPGLPFHVVTALKPTHLVLIEADSEVVISRRTRDPKRYRDTLNKEELESELLLARSFLTTASSIIGAPMMILRNEEGRVEETVQRLIDVLREARP
ncbi:MAG TPA: adenylate kinase [Nitrososphaerales archaeon]|nr:adenylate kinase [Nitrososphaerales archaeon]